MEIVARCKAEGLGLTMEDILSNSTIRQMASLVKGPWPGTAMIGHDDDAEKVSRVQDSSGVRCALKLAPRLVGHLARTCWLWGLELTDRRVETWPGAFSVYHAV